MNKVSGLISSLPPSLPHFVCLRLRYTFSSLCISFPCFSLSCLSFVASSSFSFFVLLCSLPSPPFFSLSPLRLYICKSFRSGAEGWRVEASTGRRAGEAAESTRLCFLSFSSILCPFFSTLDHTNSIELLIHSCHEDQKGEKERTTGT